MSAAKKPVPDWDRIEIDYRAGVKTLRQIADEHGITHGAVNKRAKAKSWARDLNAKIQAQAEAKVSKAAVSTEVSKAKAVTETTIVEANADAIVRIRLAHRQDIGRTRGLFRTMLGELEASSTPEGQALLEEMFDVVHGKDDPEDKGSRRAEKLRQMLDRALELRDRVDTAKKLAETLEKLVRLEREAFGIAAVTAEPDTPQSAAPSPTDARAYYAWLTQQGA